VAGSIAARAERELRSLVGVSSPSGDVAGAEEALAIAEALAPEQATSARVPCSSPEHAPDLILRLAGTGEGRLLLVGHVVNPGVDTSSLSCHERDRHRRPGT